MEKIIDGGINVIIVVFFLLTWFVIMELSESIRKWFTAKSDLTESQKKNTDITIYSTRMELTLQVLTTIDTIIQTKVLSKMKNLQLIDTPYNMLNLSDDVEEMSREIYSSICEDFMLTEKYTMLKPEFIMVYITSQTALRFAETAKSMNIQLYVSKNEET